MPRLKFVNSLSEMDRFELNSVYKNHPNFRVRQRAHAMLLSHQGHTINQLQVIFQVNRDAISRWIDLFNARGIDGLEDMPRSGRPRIYSEDEIKIFKTELDKEPRQIKKAQADLEKQTGKKSCLETLKRILKNSTILGDAVGAL